MPSDTPLADLAGRTPDEVLERFTDWVTSRGIQLYAAQEEATLALATGANVILATPTGSGKSLVAVGALAQAVGRGERGWYTAPIKALVSEKFFDLMAIFGAQQVGMLTGDAAVNAGAPIICATAEVLANQALRDGDVGGPERDEQRDGQGDGERDGQRDVGHDLAGGGVVVMDEFHYYADRDRGWAWQVPLLLLPEAQFLLMSATLGDTTFFEDDLRRRTRRETVAITGTERPVPLEFDWAMVPPHDTIELLLREGKGPVYVVHTTQSAAVERAQSLTSLTVATPTQKARIKEAVGGFRFGKGFGTTLKRLVLHGIGVHHAGMLPKYRRLVETLAQEGLLQVIAGTDTLGVGINVPIRTVLLTSLAKFDGRKDRLLRAREFHQIAGRAGRAGFDSVGYVVVQAPDHVIENARALAKVAGDPKKARRVAKRKPPEGQLSYTEATFERLVAAPPEPLTSHLRITHAMVLTALERWDGQQETLHTVLLDNHENDLGRMRLLARADQLLASMLVADVIEPDDGSDVADWLPIAEATEPPPADDPQPNPPKVEKSTAFSSLGDVLREAGLGDLATEPHGSTDEAPNPHPDAAEHAQDATDAPPSRIESWLRGIPTTPDGPFQIAVDLQDGFALNQPLSAFALAAFDVLDTQAPTYALDVVSVIEATLEDPRPVLFAQQFEARGEAVAAMKADGYDYEERMEALEEVTWPKPLAELLEAGLTIYRQRHPWVDPRGLRPKSVVRDLFERGMTFGEYVAHYKLARVEGVVLRYLTDAYRALRSTVPAALATEEVEDLIQWLGALVRGTDSSLLDEWESLVNPVDPEPSAAGRDVRPPAGRGLSANPRALRTMVRGLMFRRVELLSRRAYAALAALDEGREGAMAEDAWRAAGEEYFAEYGSLDTGADARGPGLFTVAEEEGQWTLTQILEDPDGDHDWRVTAHLDLAATDEDGEPVLATVSLAPA